MINQARARTTTEQKLLERCAALVRRRRRRTNSIQIILQLSQFNKQKCYMYIILI